MSRIEEALAKAQLNHAERIQRKPVQEPYPRREPAGCPVDVQESLARAGVPQPNLVVINDPFSLQAEEYRKLKEALIKKTKGKSLRNLVMVSSPSGGEGKTVTAINLAASLAMEYDHTVLLVDADLRGPSCHEYLGYELEHGLSDCMAKGCDIGPSLIKTGIGRLGFLPAGRKIANPGEVFSSLAMKALIREIKERYPDRYVIIDTPPVLPFAETRSLSQLVDGVLMVVREGQTSLKQTQEAVKALKNNVLGVVYNGSSQGDTFPGADKYYS